MGETTNYKLYIEDDSSTKFMDWRKKMNGSNESNMVMIDRILFGKANSSIVVMATLSSSAWVGVDSPYTQELFIDGLREGTNGIIDVAHNATVEQREIAREAMLSVIGQEDGKLIIAADGEMPESDIPVYIIILG